MRPFISPIDTPPSVPLRVQLHVRGYGVLYRCGREGDAGRDAAEGDVESDWGDVL